jgi:type II secretory pathway pseudopilin PulG
MIGMLCRVHSRGMSLMLELLIGFAVLAIAVMSIFLLFPSSDKAVMRAARTNQANELARSILEEATAQDYSALVVGLQDGLRNEVTLSRNGQDIRTQFNFEVETTQPDPTRELKNIRVRVFWEVGSDGRERECVLETSKGEFF